MPYRPSIIGALLALLATPVSAGNVIDPYTLFPPTGGGAAPVVATVATGEDVTPTSSVTVSAPSGLAEDDTVIVLNVDGIGWGSQVGFQTLPDGSWNTLQKGLSAYNARLYTYWQVASAGEPSTWDFGGLNEATAVKFAALRITGADTVSPIDASAVAEGAASNPTCPSVTTTGPNRIVLTFVNAGNAEGGDAPVPTMNGTVVASGTVEYGGWGVDERVQAEAGPSGTFVHTAGTTTFLKWVCVTVAVKP